MGRGRKVRLEEKKKIGSRGVMGFSVGVFEQAGWIGLRWSV